MIENKRFPPRDRDKVWLSFLEKGKEKEASVVQVRETAHNWCHWSYFKIVSHKTSEDQETIWPLNSNEWPRQIFSSKYQCNIIQTCKWWEQRSNQLGDYWLIQNQILRTKIISIVWQTGRRITNEILGVKGLTGACSCGEPVQLLFLLLKRCKKSCGSLETN